MSFRTPILLCCLACALLIGVTSNEDYLVGIGKADITGPVADINLMGYANPAQFAGGIHTRLFARAFIVADVNSPNNRFVFVNLDACMAAQAVTFTLIDRLKQRYGPDFYTEQNVALSGTHTHSGPAGYLQYLIYDITGLGFVPQTFHALVDGIELAIVRAHESLQPGSLSVAHGELLEANINRSPTAYVANPEEERAKFKYDIDKEMTLLVVEGEEGDAIGAFSWFPVHGTSVNNTNQLVNGDNKGAAAQFMERKVNAQQREARKLRNGDGKKSDDKTDSGAENEFIAAFCQANVGDTSPNTQGAFCQDTGLPCDAEHSTCEGRVQQCIGRGPAWPNHFESARIIGAKQADKAQELFEDEVGRVKVSGPVESRHMFLDMRGLEIEASPYTRAGATCKAAMGFAFAAGTTDGPGAFDFTQSDTNGTAFWRLVRNFITKPTPEQEACHAPKPILLDVGEMHFPYEWAPYIVEIQILRAGQFIILAVPGELTTMAGRRLVAAVRDVVKDSWGPDVHIVIAGLSNTYSSYVTTWEEYQVQRYEGGFTLFGPHTLDAYIQEFRSLASAMVDGVETPPGPPPPNMLAKQWSLVPGVVADGVPFGADFGTPSKDIDSDAIFYPGDQVSAEFHSACPRNDIRAEDTFLTVERLVESSRVLPKGCFARVCDALKRFFFGGSSSSTVLKSGGGGISGGVSGASGRSSAVNQNQNEEEWEVVHTDNDWETKFSWARHMSLSTHSFATITWDIPQDVRPGTYRLRHFGDYKHFLGKVHPFEGASKEFEVRTSESKEESDGVSGGESSWAGIMLRVLARRGIWD